MKARSLLLVPLLMLALIGLPQAHARAQSSEWRPLGPALEHENLLTFAAPTWPRDRVLFAASDHWLTRSDDDGATWIRLPHRFGHLKVVAATPGADRTGLVLAVDAPTHYQSTPRILRSTDSGMTWVVAAEIAQPYFQITGDAFTFTPGFKGSGIAYFLDSGQLLRTTDFGASWEWISIGSVTGSPDGVAQIGQHIRQVSVSADFERDRTIFASAAVGRTFPGPENNDAERRRQAEGLPPPLTTNHLTSLGVIVSHDAGDTWSSVSAGPELNGQPARFVASLRVGPQHGQDHTLFAFALGAPAPVQIGQEARLSYPNGLFRSLDGGETWTLIWNRPTTVTDASQVGVEAFQLFASPAFAEDRTLIAAINRTQQVRETSGISQDVRSQVAPRCDVYRSFDGGTSWNVVLASPQTYVHHWCPRMDSSANGRAWHLLFPGSGVGMAPWKRSDDGGLTWHELPSPPRARGGTGLIRTQLGPEGEVLTNTGESAWTLGGPAPAQPGSPVCPIAPDDALRPSSTPFSSLDRFGCAAEPARTVSVRERRLYSQRGLWFDDDSTEWLLLNGAQSRSPGDPSESGLWSWRSKAAEPWSGPPDRILTALIQRAWGGVLFRLTADDNSQFVIRATYPNADQPTEYYWEGTDPNYQRPQR